MANRIRQSCINMSLLASYSSLTRLPFAPPPVAMAPPARGTWACIWDHGTTPPTPFHYQLPPGASGEHVLVGAPCQLGQRGLD